MARCAYCNSLILFGGFKNGGHTFCNAKCAQNAFYLSVAQQIPESNIVATIEAVDRSGCPSCKGAGPIEVYNSYWVWSALLLTQWGSSPKVCCKRCGVKSQLGSLGFSLLLGWWGFPWGLIWTPIQIGRNFYALFTEPQHPSPALKRIISLNIASQMVAQQKQQQQIAAAQAQATPPPPPPPRTLPN